MDTNNLIFLENLEWFDQTGQEIVHRPAYRQGRATAAEAYHQLARALSFLRAELASGSLPAPAWIVQGWLTRILQGITVGWIE